MAVTSYPQILDGDQILARDFEEIYDGSRTLNGNTLAGLLGVPTALPMRNAFTVTAGTGMQIIAGGSGGQSLFIDSAKGPRFVDQVPAQAITIAAASSQPRNDLLVATYSKSLTPSITRNNESTGGSISTETAQDEGESLSYAIVQGTPAATPSDPTSSIPGGAIAVARIIVPANTTSIVQGNIVVLPPTMQSLILAGITSAGYVDLSTNQSIGGNKTFTGTTTIGGIAVLQTDTNQNGVCSIRRNGVGSIIISPGAPGNGIYIGYDCSTISSINFGPINQWGSITAAGYTSPDGTAIYGSNVQVGNGYIHAGPNNLYFSPVRGDIIADRGDGTGVLYLGNQSATPGQHYLYCNGSDYTLPNGNLFINGIYFTDRGAFQVNNPGATNYASFVFGNPSSSGALTQIGANNVSVSSINASLFHVGANNGTTYFAIDSTGNVGILNNLNVANSIIASGGNFTYGLRVGSSATGIGNAGDLAIARSASPNTGYAFFNQAGTAYIGFDGTLMTTPNSFNIGGSATVTGSLKVGGATIPNSYVSDGSVGITQSGQQLNLSLAGGYCNSYASDGSMGVSASGRTLTVLSSYIMARRAAAITAAGSITLTLPTLPSAAGRTWTIYATASSDIASGGNMSLAGSFAATKTVGDSTTGSQTIEILGTASGGTAPTATFNISGLGGSGGGGIFRLEASVG